MATIEVEHIFQGKIETVFGAISNYLKYKDFIPGVSKVEILPAKEKGSKCQVRFEVNMIKSFHYTLNMFEESPSRIWWTLEDSNLMKENVGGWTFKAAADGKTKASYSLDVKFKGFMPSALTDQVAKANMPSMLEGFQKLINGTKSVG